MTDEMQAAYALVIPDLKSRLACGPNDEAGIGAFEVMDELVKAIDGEPRGIDRLLALHKELLEGNEYAYFELAYTRTTGWMAFICDRPAGGTVGTPEFGAGRTILAQGQGETPDAACLDALSSYPWENT
jgi:hypothetical protein